MNVAAFLQNLAAKPQPPSRSEGGTEEWAEELGSDSN